MVFGIVEPDGLVAGQLDGLALLAMDDHHGYLLDRLYRRTPRERTPARPRGWASPGLTWVRYFGPLVAQSTRSGQPSAPVMPAGAGRRRTRMDFHDPDLSRTIGIADEND